MDKDRIIKLSQSCMRQAQRRLSQAETAKTKKQELREKQGAILNLNLASELRAIAEKTDQFSAFDDILEEISQTQEQRVFLIKYLSCGISV